MKRAVLALFLGTSIALFCSPKLSYGQWVKVGHQVMVIDPGQQVTLPFQTPPGSLPSGSGFGECFNNAGMPSSGGSIAGELSARAEVNITASGPGDALRARASISAVVQQEYRFEGATPIPDFVSLGFTGYGTYLAAGNQTGRGGNRAGGTAFVLRQIWQNGQSQDEYLALTTDTINTANAPSSLSFPLLSGSSVIAELRIGANAFASGASVGTPSAVARAVAIFGDPL